MRISPVPQGTASAEKPLHNLDRDSLRTHKEKNAFPFPREALSRLRSRQFTRMRISPVPQGTASAEKPLHNLDRDSLRTHKEKNAFPFPREALSRLRSRQFTRMRISPVPQGTAFTEKTDPNKDRFFLVGEGGFEPPKRSATDLQSAPFGHSGTLPYVLFVQEVCETARAGKWSW